MTNLRDATASHARRITTLLLVMVLGVGLSSAVTTSAQAATDRLTVLIGTSGLTWADVSVSTPNLLLATEWPAGSLAARSVGAYSCPADGWLAVSAGVRARSAVHSGASGGETAGGATGCPEQPSTFAQHTAQAAQDSYDATPGLFGQALRDAGTRAVGIGDGARIALADRQGAVVGQWQSRRDNLAAQARQAVAGLPGGGLLVVDLGPTTTPTVQQTDARFGQVLAELPDDARVLLASLADGGREPHLQAAAYRMDGNDRTHLLTSESTRQPGYLTATDVAPTLLASLGVPVPVAMTGAAIRGEAAGSRSAQERLVQLRDPDLAAQQMNAVVPWFVVVTYLPMLVILGWAWWRGSRRSGGWPWWIRPLAGAVGVVPAATFLAQAFGWWRTPAPFLALESAVLLIAAVLALPCLWLAPRFPAAMRPWWLLGWPGAVTFGVLALDLLGGSRRQISSMIGLQPLVAGRFYGLGNPQFALFGTASLLLAGAIAGWLLTSRPTPAEDHWSQPRRIAAASVLTVAVFALTLDATPGLGSDFGGPPALFPAMILLTTLVLGFAVTWRRVALAGVATVLLMLAVCFADWLRPPAQRTHLGRVFQTMLDGGLGPVIQRKLATNVELLVSAPYTIIIPLVTALAAWYLLTPRSAVLRRTYAAAPVVRHVLVAWFVMVTIAFLLNDSGVVVPPVAGALLVPALLAFLPWPSEPAPRPVPAAPRGSGRTGLPG